MKNNLKNDWTKEEVVQIYDQPFNDLLFQAQTIHRQHFNPNEIQISTLFSIKTGKCPEDCKYCSQSAHYKTDLKTEKLVEIDKVVEAAKEAAASGASRFCVGAAWRNPTQRDMPYLVEAIHQIKSLGLESCMTLGKLNPEQCTQLAEAGLDYYNHNLDTSREYYEKVITTRTYDDRLETIQNVRDAGMKVCCGGIIGMGENRQDRIGLLWQLATMAEHPESVPINQLIQIKGTPLEHTDSIDSIEFIRTIATARILMPASYVRLSAGRESMSDAMQALAFLAGANSLFYGTKLLTTSNAVMNKDIALLKRLNIENAERLS